MAGDNTSTFLIISAFGRLSQLELASIMDSGLLDFRVLKSTGIASLVECDAKTASVLVKKTGGSYKIAKVCGQKIDDLLEGVLLPEGPKFNWTVSEYGCTSELIGTVKLSVQDLLKSKSLGKSRFLNPDVIRDLYQEETLNETEGKRGEIRELVLKELYENILFPKDKRPTGLDIVVVGGLVDSPIFGYTIAASDVLGFEKRDFSRPYQDPTVTIGPRLGRVLVNLAMSRANGVLLDPFCGLGTILQEGLMLGYGVVGIDISQSNIRKSKVNLGWIQSAYQATQRSNVTLTLADATTLKKQDLPKIDGIATEPILLPKFERNPTSEVVNDSLRKVAALYEKSVRVFRKFLDANSRIAIIVPSIIDNKGMEHKVELGQTIVDSGFKLYSPSAASLKFEYPFKVETSKKKIIQRNVYVMVAC